MAIYQVWVLSRFMREKRTIYAHFIFIIICNDKLGYSPPLHADARALAPLNKMTIINGVNLLISLYTFELDILHCCGCYFLLSKSKSSLCPRISSKEFAQLYQIMTVNDMLTNLSAKKQRIQLWLTSSTINRRQRDRERKTKHMKLHFVFILPLLKQK